MNWKDLETSPLMFDINALEQTGKRIICGVDECGRGSWAGPIVAGCAVFTTIKDVFWQQFAQRVRDSKQLSAEARYELANEIRQRAFIATSYLSNTMIENIGLEKSNTLVLEDAIITALTKAYGGKQPDYSEVLILVNGKHISMLNDKNDRIEYVCFPKADAKSFTVAAASIIGKAERDSYMIEQDSIYPQYKFAAHKGYGTPEHKRLLNILGPCAIHRRTFKPIQEAINRRKKKKR